LSNVYRKEKRVAIFLVIKGGKGGGVLSGRRRERQGYRKERKKGFSFPQIKVSEKKGISSCTTRKDLPGLDEKKRKGGSKPALGSTENCAARLSREKTTSHSKIGAAVASDDTGGKVCGGDDLVEGRHFAGAFQVWKEPIRLRGQEGFGVTPPTWGGGGGAPNTERFKTYGEGVRPKKKKTAGLKVRKKR